MQVKINGKAEEFPGGTCPRSAHRPRRLNRRWLQSKSMTVWWNANILPPPASTKAIGSSSCFIWEAADDA